MGRKFIITGIILLLAIVGTKYVILKPEKSVEVGHSEQRKIFTSQEYGLSVTVPEGWNYNTITQGKAEGLTLIVELIDKDKKVFIPIFAEDKSWEVALSEVRKNFIPEAIEEITLSGQSAVKLVETAEEINPGYIFRIRHPKRKNVVLSGTAFLLGGGDLKTFHNLVETVLNSIKFN